MKKTVRNILFVLLSLYVIMFAYKKSTAKQPGLTEISIWYMPNATEAKDPPSDWNIYKRLRDEVKVDLKLKRLPTNGVDNSAYILDAAENGGLPDFFRVSHGTLVELIKRNKVEEVSQMFQYMPERTKRLYTSRAIKSGTFDKTVYALAQPSSISRNEGLVIRKDWLDNLGLSIPKTLDEFYNVMYAFTYNDPDKNGKNDTYGFGAFIECNANESGLGKRFSPILGAFGCEVLFDFDAMKAKIDSEDYYDAMKFINKMSENGLIDPFWYSYKKEEFRNAWKAGRFGCMREQFAALARKDNYDKFDERFPEGEWIVIDPPTGKNGKSSNGPDLESFRLWAVKAGLSKEKKIKIAEMLEWMSTDGFEEIVFGQENVNFIRKDGVISDDVADKSKAYSGKEFARYRQLMNLVSDYKDENILRPQYPSFVSRNGREIDCLEILKQLRSTKFSETQNLPDMSRKCRQYYEAKLQAFIINPKTLTKESWDSFLKEFHTIGGDEWTERIRLLNL